MTSLMPHFVTLAKLRDQLAEISDDCGAALVLTPDDQEPSLLAVVHDLLLDCWIALANQCDALSTQEKD